MWQQMLLYLFPEGRYQAREIDEMVDQIPNTLKPVTMSIFEVRERKAAKKAAAEARAEMKAEMEAIAQATAQEKRETIIGMYQEGLSIDLIARITKRTELEIYDLLRAEGLV
jgi:hypothetical protein